MGRVSPINLSPTVTFEGTRRFVGALGPAMGEDDLSAAVPAAPAGSGVVIEQHVCTRIRCVFVARIDDTQPNRGAAISEPSAAVPVDIRISGSMFDYTARLNVVPADTADAVTMGTGEITGEAVYSSLTLPAGATLRATMQEQPVRIAVLGAVQLQGRVDLSPSATRPGAGGHAGGTAPMGDGQGPSAGLGNAGAGGGGGHATAGAAGMAAAGAPGGAGGAVSTRRRLDGGSGGGAGGGAAGGHGGGAFLLAGFHTMDLTGARFVLTGAAGQGSAGGGAGGMLLLAGEVSGAFAADVRGGAGGTAAGAVGGAGGNGRVRIEGNAGTATLEGATVERGPRFDLASVVPIVRDAQVSLRGSAAPGARVRVDGTRLDATAFTSTVVADASGAWTASVRLPEGVVQIMLTDVTDPMMPLVGMHGTRIVVRGDAGARTIAGGAIDIAYLPVDG